MSSRAKQLLTKLLDDDIIRVRPSDRERFMKEWREAMEDLEMPKVPKATEEVNWEGRVRHLEYYTTQPKVIYSNPHVVKIIRDIRQLWDEVQAWRQKSVSNRLPERLTREQAEPICELTCTDLCHGDCDCNPDVQIVWETLKGRLENPDG